MNRQLFQVDVMEMISEAKLDRWLKLFDVEYHRLLKYLDVEDRKEIENDNYRSFPIRNGNNGSDCYDSTKDT